MRSSLDIDFARLNGVVLPTLVTSLAADDGTDGMGIGFTIKYADEIAIESSFASRSKKGGWIFK